MGLTAIANGISPTATFLAAPVAPSRMETLGALVGHVDIVGAAIHREGPGMLARGHGCGSVGGAVDLGDVLAAVIGDVDLIGHRIHTMARGPWPTRTVVVSLVAPSMTVTLWPELLAT